MLPLPCRSPKQYQDVKANLQWYSTVVLAVIGVSFYFVILPASQQRALNGVFGGIASSRLVGPGAVLVFFGFVGWLLVFAFEIHDRIYDRHFTKWRLYYDVDFILPALVRPFSQKLSPRFFPLAVDNRYAFMKPFYHFVADYEHEHKIRENLIVRFYEAVTKYWMTQINEILLLLLVAVTFAYFLVYMRCGLVASNLLVVCFVIDALFIVNRYAVRRSRESVRQATLDEVEDIHERYLVHLDRELGDLHKKFDLTYGTKQN